jgi:hypothetical protein
VTFDSKSDVINKNLLKTTDRSVQLDGGVAGGFTFFDGIISIGVGYLNYDQRDFNQSSPDFKWKYTSNYFGYVNIQPISAIRSAIKKIKD